jgi:hypothetical protein
MFDNDEAKKTLCACGMYKLFQVGGMREKRRLTNLLIDYWNHDAEEIMLAEQSLTITVKFIYFIIDLLRRGEVPNFQNWGGGQSINDFINEYCIADNEKSGSQVPIKKITNLSLQIIIFTLVWILGSNSLHLASRPQMGYVV